MNKKKELKLYNEFEIIKFNFNNDTTNNIEYLKLLKVKESLEKELELLKKQNLELREKYTNSLNEYEYNKNTNAVLLNEINENQKILDELKNKIELSLGDIEKENYRNILLKTYTLENIIDNYNKFLKEKIDKNNIYEYNKNLIKDYILFNILNEYESFIKT